MTDPSRLASRAEIVVILRRRTALSRNSLTQPGIFVWPLQDTAICSLFSDLLVDCSTSYVHRNQPFRVYCRLKWISIGLSSQDRAILRLERRCSPGNWHTTHDGRECCCYSHARPSHAAVLASIVSLTGT